MIDRERLLNTFLALVQIDSPSGEEEAIGAELAKRLRELDMTVHVDDIGNVLGRWDGKEPLLLNAHMDTVTPGCGVRPIVEGDIVRSDGHTVLGSDDKSGVAVILEVLRSLHERGQRPAVEVAFTVQEEIGLLGSQALDIGWFRSRQALVLDAEGLLHEVVHGAPGSDRLDAVIHGRAAHAGVNPEDGVSAIVIAARAIAAMPLGRVDPQTTANIGLIKGGEAINIIPALAELHGEARSHDSDKLAKQIAAMRQALEDAVAEFEQASLEIDIQRIYNSYRLDPSLPLFRRIEVALAAMGEPPLALRLSGGGSDANVFNERGIAAVPISTGMQDVHTTAEWISLSDMARCAELVLRVLTVGE